MLRRPVAPIAPSGMRGPCRIWLRFSSVRCGPSTRPRKTEFAEPHATRRSPSATSATLSTPTRMTAHPAPQAAVSCLPRADGSARHSHAGFTITASVNGPLEAQRRDEHPYEAHVDVIVRPAAGVGGSLFRAAASSWTDSAHSSCRHEGTTSRVRLGVFTVRHHSRAELPPKPDSDCPTN